MNLDLKDKLEKFYDDNVWEHKTLGELLRELAYKYEDKIAVVDGETEISYRQLDRESDNYARGLLKTGIKAGDRALLQLPNCYEFLVIAFALFKIGAVPIMSLPAHRKNEIKGIIEKSEAKVYIAKEKYLGFSYIDMIKEIKKEVEKNLDVYIIGNSGEYREFSELSDAGEEEIKGDIDYKSVGLLLLSGGTTGIPKLIPRRHCDYIYVAKKVGERCKLNEESVYLASLPIAHNFPLGCPGIVGTLSAGGKVIICPVTSPDEILPLIEEHKVTATGLVPAMAALCSEFIEDGDYDVSTLEILQIGGSVLEPHLAKAIEGKFNTRLQQIFGIAEGLILTTDFQDDDEIRHHTQGKPVSEFDEILVVDEDLNEVNTGEFGELIVRGAYTIYGYYKLPEVNKECITEGCYFRTGDKARKLNSGNYQIAGRIKEIINRAGEKITPSELEEILMTNEKINSVQVVGVPDELLGEAIVVFITNSQHEKLSIEEVRKFLILNNLAEFKLPDQVVYIDSWPLTALGKIDRKKLKSII